LPKPFYLQYNYPTPIVEGTPLAEQEIEQTAEEVHVYTAGEGIMINAGQRSLTYLIRLGVNIFAPPL
jgi:hypothetical protein